VPEPAAIKVLEEPQSVIPFINPQPRGGSWLDKDTGSGLGEPLNVSPSNTPSFAIQCVPLATDPETK
jgi:hypothetical protein